MAFDVDEALKRSVIFLATEEETLRRTALAQLTEKILAISDPFDVEEVEAGTSDISYWLSTTGTLPFLSERRTLVVRQALRSINPKEISGILLESFKGLPPSALLILVADDEAGDQDKQRRIDSLRTQWAKFVKEIGGYIYNDKLDANAVKNTLKAEVNKLGKTMSDKAISTLIDMSGGSLSRASEELQKVAIYVGNSSQISESDIKSIAIPSLEWNVFKLTGAALSGGVTEALLQLRILVGKHNKPEEVAFQSILPTMSKQVRLIWQARLCVESGTGITNAPDKVLALFPKKPNLLSEPDWTHKRYFDTARRINLNQIAVCMQELADADARIKGLLPAYSVVETLEQMILKMCEVTRLQVKR